MISVVVTHYKTPDLLTACLQSLVRARAVLSEPCEITVVDSETQPEHQMLAQEAVEDVRWLGVRGNVGYARLVNRGLAESSGRYVLVLNADIIADPGSIAELIGFMDANPAVGIAGPQLRGFDGRVQASRFRFYTPMTVLARRTAFGKTSLGRALCRSAMMEDVPLDAVHDADWLLGSALMVRREALETVDGMDEGFFLYFEDVDWCRRMWENGFRVVYVPSALMYHYHQRASDSGRGLLDFFVNKTTRVHLRSAARYFWKYRGRPDPRGMKRTEVPASA